MVPVIRPDAGARIRVEHDGPWLVLLIDRPRRTKRIYLGLDEAAQVVAVLSKELPPIEVRQVAGRPA